jgi:hypothetical protein
MRRNPAGIKVTFFAFSAERIRDGKERRKRFPFPCATAIMFRGQAKTCSKITPMVSVGMPGYGISMRYEAGKAIPTPLL